MRGAVFMASGGGLELLLRFGSIAVLARLLVPEDFGLVAMATALTAVLELIRDLGLATVTVQRHDITHRQVSNLFWVNAGAGLAFTLAFWALSPAIADFYHDQRLVAATMVVSTTFLWSGLSVQHEALMSRQLKQGDLAFIRLLASFLSILVAVALASGKFGYWALVWREVSRSAFVAIGIWMRCPWVPGLPSQGVGTRSMLRFGRDLTMTHLLIAVVANIDRILIGRFFGPSAVGLYRQAQQLLMVPIDQLNGPIMAVAQPGLSALQSEPSRYRSYYEKIVFLVTLATFPLGVFVAIYAEEVTHVLLGSAWSEAAVFIRIFGIAAAIRPASATSAVVLVTCGYSVRYFWLAVIHSVVLAAFLMTGVRWGTEGVALAHIATTVLLMLPKLYYSFAQTPIRLGDFGSAVRTPIVAGAAMAAGLAALRSLTPVSGAVLQLFVGAGVGTALYLGAWLLQRDGRKQCDALFKDLASSLQRKGVLG